MLRLNAILGSADDAALAGRLHDLEHAGALETVLLSREDLARRRLRTHTDRGSECAIALSRQERLFDGAVLLLEASRAVVVHMEPERWLPLRAADQAAALELGYFAGNMHWRVRFDGEVLRIALNGPEEDYLARLAPLLDGGRVRRAADE